MTDKRSIPEGRQVMKQVFKDVNGGQGHKFTDRFTKNNLKQNLQVVTQDQNSWTYTDTKSGQKQTDTKSNPGGTPSPNKIPNQKGSRWSDDLESNCDLEVICLSTHVILRLVSWSESTQTLTLPCTTSPLPGLRNTQYRLDSSSDGWTWCPVCLGLGVHGHSYLTDFVSVHLPLATSPKAPRHWQSHGAVPIRHVTIGPGLVNGCSTGTNMVHLHSANWAISACSNVYKMVHSFPFLFTCILLMIE
jgi:hypothetical protein